MRFNLNKIVFGDVEKNREWKRARKWAWTYDSVDRARFTHSTPPDDEQRHDQKSDHQVRCLNVLKKTQNFSNRKLVLVNLTKKIYQRCYQAECSVDRDNEGDQSDWRASDRHFFGWSSWNDWTEAIHSQHLFRKPWQFRYLLFVFVQIKFFSFL